MRYRGRSQSHSLGHDFDQLSFQRINDQPDRLTASKDTPSLGTCPVSTVVEGVTRHVTSTMEGPSRDRCIPNSDSVKDGEPE